MIQDSNLQVVEDTALQQAAEWFALLRSGHTQQTDFAAWEAWLQADAKHRAAWQAVESIDASFNQATNLGNAQAVKSALLHQPSASRRQALKLLGVAGTTLVAGWILKSHSPWRDWLTNIAASELQYEVGIGQTRLFTLAEGTKLWLNTASQAEVSYSVALRRITLLTGELLVTSAKEHATLERPLVVDTSHGRITAIGTRFTVRLHEKHTYVAVYEGAVAIKSKSGGHLKVLKAGQQVQFNALAIKTIQPAEKAREAWTRGILLADNRQLDDFMAELARYRHGQIAVSPNIAHLRIMGAFPINDIDRVLNSITESLPVRIEQINTLDILLVEK